MPESRHRPAPPRNLWSVTPSSAQAAASSPMRYSPSRSSESAARWAIDGGMISPSSPSVQVTSVTRAPSAAYLAIVAPVPIDSSSGCACTTSNRRPSSGAPPGSMDASLPAAPGSAGTGKMLWHDREFPAPGGQDQTVHARRTAGVPHLTRRCTGGLPANSERQRPGDVSVGAGRRRRAGTAGRGPADAGRRRGGPAAAGARPPGAGQGAGRRHRGLRHGRGPDGRGLLLVGAGLFGGPDPPGRQPVHPARGAGAWPGTGSAPRPDGEAAGLRLCGGTAGGQPGRPRRRPGPGGPAGRSARDVRAGRVHRGRGDGPPPRLLVVPGRFGAAGRAGGRDARHAVAYRRPRQPGAAARRGGLSGRRHPERPGVPPVGQAGRYHRGRRDRPRRVPVPGDRLLGGRARTAGGGAEPRPADDAAAGCRRRYRPGRGAARGHRRALAGGRSRRPRLDRRRAAGVDS